MAFRAVGPDGPVAYAGHHGYCGGHSGVGLADDGGALCVAVLAAYIMQNRLVVDLRTQVFDKLQRLSFRFFDANETGSITSRDL